MNYFVPQNKQICVRYEGLLLHAFNSTKNALNPENRPFGACTKK